jgi:hypothetical protein
MRGAWEGDGEPGRRSFALHLTIACLGLALLLLFRSLVPAFREQDSLVQVEQKHLELRAHLLALRDREWAVRTALGFDPQTLRVEIDRLGLTPEQLLGEPDPFLAAGIDELRAR